VSRWDLAVLGGECIGHQSEIATLDMQNGSLGREREKESKMKTMSPKQSQRAVDGRQLLH
jgi:hypothetical protein